MIHPTAVVSSKAQIDSSVEVGPFAVIEDHVRIGGGTRVMAHAVITGYTEIGRDNQIHMGAVIGHLPQDRAFQAGSRTFLRIGDRNIFREYSTVHRGTEPDSSTVIGSGNFLMVGAHVAHNCVIGDKVIICNYACLGGHVHVGDGAFISASVLIHQYVRIGRMVMCSGGATITMDAPPFMTACERNQIWSLNLVGLQRGNVPPDAVREIKNMYKIFYRSGLNVSQALDAIEHAGFESSEVREFVEFVQNSPRGVLPHRE